MHTYDVLDKITGEMYQQSKPCCFQLSRGSRVATFVCRTLRFSSLPKSCMLPRNILDPQKQSVEQKINQMMMMMMMMMTIMTIMTTKNRNIT